MPPAFWLTILAGNTSMAEKGHQTKRNPEQVFEEILRTAGQYYSAPESQRCKELRQKLHALAEEYRELTGKRVVY